MLWVSIVGWKVFTNLLFCCGGLEVIVLVNYMSFYLNFCVINGLSPVLGESVGQGIHTVFCTQELEIFWYCQSHFLCCDGQL